MLRFLDLLCKELGADDARVEIGGRVPEDPRLLWLDVEGGFRLVLVFKETPAGRAFVQQRLVQLAAGFAHTLARRAAAVAAAPARRSILRSSGWMPRSRRCAVAPAA